VLDADAAHERRRALGLEAEHPRRVLQLLEPLPVRGHVAGVADRDAERVDLADLLDELEGRRLLAFQAQRVHRVHQRDRVTGDELAHELERAVEVALQRDHAGAVHERLGQLAGRDLALRDDDRAAQPGPGGVGRQAGRGVAGRRADHRLGAVAHGARDRAGHAAVLEGAGRVGALELEQDLGADLLRQARGGDERRRALVQRDRGVAGSEGQAVAIAVDQARHGVSRTPRR
jgi:hypothetical protein